MDYNKDYVEKHLIAYLGNKRKLLPLILEGIKNTSHNIKSNSKFLDLFAGTGVVSRMAKSLGFEVHCNDWEEYSYQINRAFVGLDASILETGFAELGGIDIVLEYLNMIDNAEPQDRYISEYYCPADDENPDILNERMFYSHANGLRIDGIRAQIAKWKNMGLLTEDENSLLLALLLYEASTRANTSGVFKGFHQGFGGTHGDALSRILKTLQLVKPVLLPGKGYVYNEDCLALSEKLQNTRFGIAYLDPPYNQHQYGSNYHLLNTIARNDKPDINKNIFVNGKKTNKSAIRTDWTKTKSTFCYKSSAEADFKKLIDNINAEHLMISYSTDGIIPFDNILDILSSKGKMDIVSSEYTKYRGGKQALTTKTKNVEFVILVDCTEEQKVVFDMGSAAAQNKQEQPLDEIKKFLILDKIKVNLQKDYSCNLLKKQGYACEKNDSGFVFSKNYGNYEVILKTSFNSFAEYESVLESLKTFPCGVLEEIYTDLDVGTSLTREEELYQDLDLMKFLNEKQQYSALPKLFGKMILNLNKFNNTSAYISSLKALEILLVYFAETMPHWGNVSILNSKAFHDLEHLILRKLEHTAHDNVAGVRESKQVVGMVYDRLVEVLQKQKSSMVSQESVAV